MARAQGASDLALVWRTVAVPEGGDLELVAHEEQTWPCRTRGLSQYRRATQARRAGERYFQLLYVFLDLIGDDDEVERECLDWLTGDMEERAGELAEAMIARGGGGRWPDGRAGLLHSALASKGRVRPGAQPQGHSRSTPNRSECASSDLPREFSPADRK